MLNDNIQLNQKEGKLDVNYPLLEKRTHLIMDNRKQVILIQQQVEKYLEWDHMKEEYDAQVKEYMD